MSDPEGGSSPASGPARGPVEPAAPAHPPPPSGRHRRTTVAGRELTAAVDALDAAVAWLESSRTGGPPPRVDRPNLHQLRERAAAATAARRSAPAFGTRAAPPPRDVEHPVPPAARAADPAFDAIVGRLAGRAATRPEPPPVAAPPDRPSAAPGSHPPESRSATTDRHVSRAGDAAFDAIVDRLAGRAAERVDRPADDTPAPVTRGERRAVPPAGPVEVARSDEPPTPTPPPRREPWWWRRLISLPVWVWILLAVFALLGAARVLVGADATDDRRPDQPTDDSVSVATAVVPADVAPPPTELGPPPTELGPPPTADVVTPVAPAPTTVAPATTVVPSTSVVASPATAPTTVAPATTVVPSTSVLASPATAPTTTSAPTTTTTPAATTTTVSTSTLPQAAPAGRTVLGPAGEALTVSPRREPCKFGPDCLVVAFEVRGLPAFPSIKNFICVFSSGSRYVFRFSGEVVDRACATADDPDTITVIVDGLTSETVSTSD